MFYSFAMHSIRKRALPSLSRIYRRQYATILPIPPQHLPIPTDKSTPESIIDEYNSALLSKQNSNPDVAQMTPERPYIGDSGHILDSLFVSCLNDITSSSSSKYLNIPSINQLCQESYTLAQRQLDYALPYEPTPDQDRRIDVMTSSSSSSSSSSASTQTKLPSWSVCAENVCKLRNGNRNRKISTEKEQDDGIVLVAHVHSNGTTQSVSWSMGMGIHSRPQDPNLILSCLHTIHSLRHSVAHNQNEPSSSHHHNSRSCSLVLTRSGHVYPVKSILSSLPQNDLALFQLDPYPLYHNNNPSSTINKIQTLPFNPYPARQDEKQAAYLFSNNPSWMHTDIAVYTDFKGCEAQPGTYDELANMSISIIPTPGSSGGPLVDVKTGSVTGIIRGSGFRHGDQRTLGFVTPAERVFEMFKLPGFQTTAERLQNATS